MIARGPSVFRFARCLFTLVALGLLSALFVAPAFAGVYYDGQCVSPQVGALRACTELASDISNSSTYAMCESVVVGSVTTGSGYSYQNLSAKLARYYSTNGTWIATVTWPINLGYCDESSEVADYLQLFGIFLAAGAAIFAVRAFVLRPLLSNT